MDLQEIAEHVDRSKKRVGLPCTELMQWIADCEAQGWDKQAMCDALNEAGIPTHRGTEWYVPALSQFKKLHTPPAAGPSLAEILDAMDYIGVPGKGYARLNVPTHILISWMKHRQAEGWTPQDMCIELNRAGIPTYSNKVWSTEHVERFAKQYCK